MTTEEARQRAQQAAASAVTTTGEQPAGKSDLATIIRQNERKLSEALAGMIDPALFVSTALGAIRSNPQLGKASRVSILSSLMQAAQLGLMPNTLGECYLVPYENRNENRIDAQLIIGYQGLISLVRRSGFVDSISAHVVRSDDTFEFEYGIDEKLRHVPNPAATGPIEYVYAYAKLRGGGYHFEVMPIAEVLKIRDKSPGARKSSSPWNSHPEEMMRKTAIRRLVKFLPKSTRMMQGIQILEGEAPDLDPGETLGSLEALPAAAEAPELPEPPSDTPPEVKTPQGERTAPETAKPEEPERRKPGRPPGSRNKVEPREAPADPTADFPIDENGRIKPGGSVDLFTGEIRDPAAEEQERRNRAAAEKAASSIPGFDD